MEGSLSKEEIQNLMSEISVFMPAALISVNKRIEARLGECLIVAFLLASEDIPFRLEVDGKEVLVGSEEGLQGLEIFHGVFDNAHEILVKYGE